MAGHYNNHSLLRGERTILVTALERDWLYDQRLRAMRECASIPWQLARRLPTSLGTWLSGLRIYRRDRDGSLEARVVIREYGSPTGYIRKLRVPAHLGSTSTRDVHLRRAPHNG